MKQVMQFLIILSSIFVLIQSRAESIEEYNKCVSNTGDCGATLIAYGDCILADKEICVYEKKQIDNGALTCQSKNDDESRDTKKAPIFDVCAQKEMDLCKSTECKAFYTCIKENCYRIDTKGSLLSILSIIMMVILI